MNFTKAIPSIVIGLVTIIFAVGAIIASVASTKDNAAGFAVCSLLGGIGLFFIHVGDS